MATIKQLSKMAKSDLEGKKRGWLALGTTTNKLEVY